VTVPDPRLEKIAQISHSKKIVPAAIEFVDIAGLVKGASVGEGLGNQFLHHIRKWTRLSRWCAASKIAVSITSARPSIAFEILKLSTPSWHSADLASLHKRYDRLQKEVRAGDKTAKNENAIIEKLLPHLDAGKPAITATWLQRKK
jgi:ribosome-binding ATPase YchF (GTP1/OBG family)